ncbi:MAG: SpoIVB peptidase S55 domain-containing protein [Acidobacteriota bacterium]
MSRLPAMVSTVALAAATLVAAPRQSTFLPVDDIRPGMVGIGRTVFENDRLEEFKVNIVGVLRNIMGPQRNLILARLEGGPLANTGVIAGMSGSPVYIDGRLIGAVSYSLGSFPKEPLAGITPIEEMTTDVSTGAPRVNAELAVSWPAPATEVFAALTRVARRASAPLGAMPGDLSVLGPRSLADLAPALRPIGAAMVLGGFDPTLDGNLRRALVDGGASPRQSGKPAAVTHVPLRPGDPIGMSLVRGDMEMGATGTVTHIDGTRVYAFGHPFLSLGPVTLAMTDAHVYTVLPSLDSSMKIASLGSVIGTITQDRATAVGGTLGAAPREVEVHISLSSPRAPERQFTFFVAQDPTLTPLFTYVSILNALTSYERQSGAMSIAAKGTISFGKDGEVAIDDVFSGDAAATAAAGAIATPIGMMVANEFKSVMPERLDFDIRAREEQQGTTIDRIWLDTTRPQLGGTYALQVQLQDFRGGHRTLSLPITLPSQADGPLTLLVSDAATLTALEQRELRPAKPASFSDLLQQVNEARRNNRLYVRLIASASGTVVAGDTLPALPASVQSLLRSDSSVARAAVTRSVVGAWDQRMEMAVRGSRELTINPKPAP